MKLSEQLTPEEHERIVAYCTDIACEAARCIEDTVLSEAVAVAATKVLTEIALQAIDEWFDTVTEEDLLLYGDPNAE